MLKTISIAALHSWLLQFFSSNF